jgi:uncharacterized membrane protein YphA (DoxX/SURF4 family)
MLNKILNCSCYDKYQGLGKLLVRLVIASIFFYHGYAKLTSPNPLEWFGVSTAVGKLVGLLECGGAVLLIMGHFKDSLSRLAGFMLLPIMGVALFMVNLPQGFVKARLDLLLFALAIYYILVDRD